MDMTALSPKDELRFRALAEAALASVGGQPIEAVAEKGLSAAIAYIELSAGALLIWDEKGEVITKAVVAAREADRAALLEVESTLLIMLRINFKLSSAYMDFGGDSPHSIFVLPLEMSGRQFGAIIGMRAEKTLLHAHDEFLRALAAVLALASAPRTVGAVIDPTALEQKIKSERSSAVVELAVAVNHEINNPLTALLGNLQLLRLKHQNLPEDLIQKLAVIEESANQISKVTARLMHVSEAPSVEYTGGMKMIDLSGNSETDSDKKNASDKDKPPSGG